MVGGRLVLEHDVTDGVMGYLSATRGYKVGGFNVSGTLDPALRQYDPEVLWNYEVGVKGSWLQGRLSARGAVFYMLRDDVQVDYVHRTLERDDGSVEFIDLISNAADGSNTRRGAGGGLPAGQLTCRCSPASG
jgi:iron complex outermembrane recepter protein